MPPPGTVGSRRVESDAPAFTRVLDGPTHPIGFLIRKAQQRHSAIFQRIMGEGAPTPRQIAAMLTLCQHGTLSQNQLGRLTSMDPATVKGVVARLVERKLVERVPDPIDQRRVRVTLTESGTAMIDPILTRKHAIVAETLEPLTLAERHQLVELLARIG